MTKSILIVEDNPMNMELVSDVLALDGYILHQAVNAEQGIEKAKTLLPDLILMDISLPGISGIEATQRLKTAQPTNHIPIIALTAHAMKGDADKIASSGLSGYIPKPIYTWAFREKIAHFFDTGEV